MENKTEFYQYQENLVNIKKMIDQVEKNISEYSYVVILNLISYLNFKFYFENKIRLNLSLQMKS
jgi:hypothetical protein